MRRVVITALACAIVGGTALALWAAEREVRLDLRHDVTLVRAGASADDASRADRWFPLTYLVLQRWVLESDYAHAEYARNVILRHGAPWTTWMFNAIDSASISQEVLVSPTPLSQADPAAALARQVHPTPAWFAHYLRHLNSSDQREVLLSLPSQPTRVIKAASPIVKAIIIDKTDSARSAAFEALYETAPSAARPWLAKAVNDDMRLLYSVQTGAQLLRIVAQFPNSRYATACREYAEIRGHAYLGDWQDPWAVWPDKRPFTPAVEERKWSAWLARYPDHPGADDAAYWLGRTLQWQGRRFEALREFADLINRPVGDGDMQIDIARQFVILLDVGTTEEDLRRFLHLTPRDPLSPAVRYALAVRLARRHHYAEALRESGRVTQIAAAAPNLEAWPFVQWPDMSAFITAQRSLWTRLATLEPAESPEQRYELASNLLSEDGWRVGYLAFNSGGRALSFAFDFGEYDVGKRSLLSTQFQAANQNAVAMELLRSLTEDQRTPAAIEEKALYLEVVALYRQIEEFPYLETTAMGPLAGFHHSKNLIASYTDAAAHATRTLMSRYPRSRYAGDALLSLYLMSGRRTYLDQLLREFPNSDRADEARAYLEVCEGVKT